MRFLHKTFEAKKKEIIEVEIDKPTKVKFMTGRDMNAYKKGKTYTYYGGMFEETPVRFVVPYDAVWSVVVEKGTFRQPLDVHASCRLMPPNSMVRSSIAVDAPEHVRQHQLAADAEADAGPLSFAARNEG
jgi:hypothetical protein